MSQGRESQGNVRGHASAICVTLQTSAHCRLPNGTEREKNVLVAHDACMIGTVMMSNQCRSLANPTKSCPGLWHSESGLLDPECLHDILNPRVIQLRSHCMNQSSFRG